MKLIFTLLFCFLILSHPLFAEIHFTNKCEKWTITLINESHKTIDIAIYSINNTNIIEALLEAKKKGIKIRILTDRLQAFGKSSKVELLHNMGFDIRVHSHDRIMHHKFAIFDRIKASEGSFNWTYSAANKNAEDCNIFDVNNDIKTLQKRFNKLWKLNTADISECYFENMQIPKPLRHNCR